MLLDTLICPVNLCCDIHSHFLPIYDATCTLIPRQFMLRYTLSFPINLCCYTKFLSLPFMLRYKYISLSIYVAAYFVSLSVFTAKHTESLSIFIVRYTFIPCQFMPLYKPFFPFNLYCYLQSHTLSNYGATYNFLPCQFMSHFKNILFQFIFLNTLSFPVNLCG